MNLPIFQNYVSASYDIITASIAQTKIKLSHDCESYLVFLMAEYFNDATLGYDSPVAIEWMTTKSMSNSHEKLNRLKRIGDTCMLISSVTPFVYSRAGLGPEYFITIGQDCYLTRSQLSAKEPWLSLCLHFQQMRDVFAAALIQRNNSKAQLIELSNSGNSIAKKQTGTIWTNTPDSEQ